MSNKYCWAVKIDEALGRISDRNNVIESSLLGIQADYRLIAETIKDAQRADPKLSQKLIAEALGKPPSWVSRILTWHERGCKDASPFSGEIAARRKAAKEEAIATSQFCPWLHGRDKDLVIDGGPEPKTTAVLKALSSCDSFIKAVVNARGENIDGAYKASDNKRFKLLEALGEKLKESITTAENVLKEVNVALEEVRPPPELDIPLSQEAESDFSIVPF